MKTKRLVKIIPLVFVLTVLMWMIVSQNIIYAAIIWIGGIAINYNAYQRERQKDIVFRFKQFDMFNGWALVYLLFWPVIYVVLIQEYLEGKYDDK